MSKGSGATGARGLRATATTAAQAPRASTSRSSGGGANWGGAPGSPEHAIARAFDAVESRTGNRNQSPIAEVFAASGLSRAAFDKALGEMWGKTVTLAVNEGRGKLPESHITGGYRGATGRLYVDMARR